MLVLTRKSNQSIMIGDDIEVAVLSVMGEKVRIGIQAPQHVPVFREEIYLENRGKHGTPGESSQAATAAPPTEVAPAAAAAAAVVDVTLPAEAPPAPSLEGAPPPAEVGSLGGLGESAEQ